MINKYYKAKRKQVVPGALVIYSNKKKKYKGMVVDMYQDKAKVFFVDMPDKFLSVEISHLKRIVELDNGKKVKCK